MEEFHNKELRRSFSKSEDEFGDIEIRIKFDNIPEEIEDLIEKEAESFFNKVREIVS